VPLSYWAFPQDADKGLAALERDARGSFEFFSDRVGPYAYAKLAHVEAAGMGGGTEHVSNIFYGEKSVTAGSAPVVHETAHQWFGDAVTERDWPHVWLSEGFATYCDALYTEHKEGIKAFNLHITKYEQLFFQFAMQAPKGSGAIKDTVSMGSGLYRPVVYEKGAVVLHMLRKVMGDEKFFRLMLAYVQQYKNKPSTVDDFRRLATEIHGKDLSWFFGQWYDRAVFAHWKIAAEVKTDTGGSSTTKITITQPEDLVIMPADITFISANQDRFVLKDVMLDKKENVLEQKTPFVPVRIIIDEDNWVLKRLGGDNIWSSTVTPPAK